jgi:hypothetical protein
VPWLAFAGIEDAIVGGWVVKVGGGGGSRWVIIKIQLGRNLGTIRHDVD